MQNQWFLEALHGLKEDYNRGIQELKTEMRLFVTQAEFKATVERLELADKHLTEAINAHISQAALDSAARETRTRWLVGISVSVTAILATVANIFLG